MEHFFETSFSDGDAEIRRGFQAYVAAVGEDDPVRRQELMFQANTLVATHEQAGAQPYLNEVMSGVPDGFASRYVDIRMGRHRVEVNDDLPDFGVSESNLVVPGSVLGLDPSTLTDDDISGETTTFGGPGDGSDVVNLDPISGWGDQGFHTSTETWFSERCDGPEFMTGYGADGSFQYEVDRNPDATLNGTGVGAWTDYDDRMWLIHRLFEQTHTDLSLYVTDSLYEGDDPVDTGYLDPEVADAISRP